MDGTLWNLFLGVSQVALKQTHVSKFCQNFTFLTTLEGIDKESKAKLPPALTDPFKKRFAVDFHSSARLWSLPLLALQSGSWSLDNLAVTKFAGAPFDYAKNLTQTSWRLPQWKAGVPKEESKIVSKKNRLEDISGKEILEKREDSKKIIFNRQRFGRTMFASKVKGVG